jgi:hypothetical protein
MTPTWLWLLIVAWGFTVVFGTGFNLASRGRPYRWLGFTFHKLIALGIGVVLWFGWADGAPGWSIAVVVPATLALAAMVASGGVMSVVRETDEELRRWHAAGAWVTLAIGIVAFFAVL